MSIPSADGYGRPPSPQVDRIEVRPHLCTRRAGARVRDMRGRHERRSGGPRWARTVGIVAPFSKDAYPKLPSVVLAPTLESRVVLRQETTEDRRLVKDEQQVRTTDGVAVK
jgi:hypothetical protein